MTPVERAEAAVLWTPSERDRTGSAIGRYLDWLRARRGLDFRSYDALWRWSVTDLEAFWSSLWEFFAVRAHRRYSRVLAADRMPGAEWFAGAELNYADHALRRRDDTPALIAGSETGRDVVLTHRELYRQTASVAASLARLGVRRGDRVVGYVSNVPEAVVAFLATASLGAVWASCAPEFGVGSVAERFGQIEPRVLFTVDGYRFKGEEHDRLAEVRQLAARLPTLEAVVLVPRLREAAPVDAVPGARPWAALLGETSALACTPVPFAHPLWVLYSSGTTGVPKAIVHSHGGILLEHLKTLALHLDLGADDRFFWYTTTGWMMWNFLVSGLLVGATVLLYDGHSGHPDLQALWQFAERTRMSYFGTSAPYLHACLKAGISPGARLDLGHLRGVGSTGAPLTPEGFRWVYEHVRRDVLLNSFSGGTDLCTGVVGACPLCPVRAGEISCRLLGAAVEAYSEAGQPVVDEVGELVITRPMPSMPVAFWNDPGQRRYGESYFERFPGVWRHGDWIKVTREGGCVIYGRSDATLNRGGVRMGTSEFYRAVAHVPGVLDSLVIDTGVLGREGRLLMFVVLEPGRVLDEGMRARIAEVLRRELSPRHVPDAIHAVAEIPYTLNGKKVEVPIKRIFLGAAVDLAVSREAIRNPECLRAFVELAQPGGRGPARGGAPA